MDRLFDPRLGEHFSLRPGDSKGMVVLTCKSCGGEWDFAVGPDVDMLREEPLAVDKGTANSLLAHANAHNGFGARLRRRA